MAREYAERWNISTPSDWPREINPWQVYNTHKQMLAQEVEPSDPAWRHWLRVISEALQV